MDFKKDFKTLKKIWDWIWNSDSLLSWIVALVLIFVFVKFIFFPTLSLLMGTSLPLAGVESSSMEHQIVKNDFGILSLCGISYSRNEIRYKDFDEYWETCGNWYEKNNLTKKQFLEFPLKNGFKKGDIVVVYGRFEPKIGDIIIFKPNPDSIAPRPIVHRIVKIENNLDNKKIFQTKGDHNEDQLSGNNNVYRTNEIKINQEQIIGKVIFRIPYLGWFKIWIVELFNYLFKFKLSLL